jgi:cobalt-precorrin 5A hydrolase
MELDQSMIIAGIGCRRRVSATEVRAAIAAAMAQLSPSVPRLQLIALPTSKDGEAGVFDAAESLGVGVVLISQVALEEANARTFTRSARSLVEMNVHSVSEAAALAAAGVGSRLLAPRIALGPVTCALAEGPVTGAFAEMELNP